MSSENTVKAVAIGCVSLAFFGFIAICGTGAWFLNSALKRPAPRPGFGIVRREGTKGEWTTYSIRDCDLHIDLKGDPYPQTARMSEWERTHLKTFSRYLCTNNMNVIIFDAEFKTSDPDNVLTFSKQFQSGAPSDPYVKNYRSEESDITVGPNHGKLVKASYVYRGNHMITRYLFLTAGKRLLALRGTGIPPPAGKAPNWDHVLQSVVWTPKGSG